MLIHIYSLNVCVFGYVCMYLGMFVCIWVCLYLSMNVCMYVCMVVEKIVVSTNTNT